MKLITFKAYHLSVEQRILYVSITKHLHYVKDAFCLGVLHCGFPVTQGMEVNLILLLLILPAILFLFLCRLETTLDLGLVKKSCVKKP